VCREKRDVEVYRQEGAFDAIDKGRRALDVAPALNRGNTLGGSGLTGSHGALPCAGANGKLIRYVR
jgi:hypothetical protein